MTSHPLHDRAGGRRVADHQDPRPRPRRARRTRRSTAGPRSRRRSAITWACTGCCRSGVETIEEQVDALLRAVQGVRAPTSTSGSSSPSSTTATRCSSTGWSASTSTRCCRSSTRPRWELRSRSSATCSGAHAGSSSTSRTSTGIEQSPRSAPVSDRTTSTWWSPRTPRPSSASATGASAASTSRSASSPSTRSRPASTRAASWPSVSTSAPTARRCSTTRATSVCVAPGCAARQYDEFIDTYVAQRQQAIPEGDPALGGLLRPAGPRHPGPVRRHPVHLRRRHPGHGRGGPRLRAGRSPGLGRPPGRPADRGLRCRLGRCRDRRPDRAGDDRGRAHRRGGCGPDLPARPSRPAHQRHDRPLRLPGALRQGPGARRRLASRGRHTRSGGGGRPT